MRLVRGELRHLVTLRRRALSARSPSHGVAGAAARSCCGTSRSARTRYLRAHCSRGERVVHIADRRRDEAYRHGDPGRRRWSSSAGARTVLVVPLRKDDALLGISSHLPPGGPPVHRQADRAVAELRRAGGHRDGERAADHRDARGAGTADRDRRGAAGHQFARPATSRRCSTRCSKRRRGCARPTSAALSTLRRRDVSHRSQLRGRAGAYAECMRAADGCPDRGTVAGASCCDGERVVHIADVAADDPE